jgi:hypothetical protein
MSEYLHPFTSIAWPCSVYTQPYICTGLLWVVILLHSASLDSDNHITLSTATLTVSAILNGIKHSHTHPHYQTNAVQSRVWLTPILRY